MNLIYRCLLIGMLFSFMLGLSSCNNNQETDYSEKILGEWQLKNTGDLEMHYKERPFLLKDATMKFNDDGSIETRMLSSRDKKTWITQTGTWTMPVNGELLSIKANNSPFDDNLEIAFTDERTFYLLSNELEYQFVKL